MPDKIVSPDSFMARGGFMAATAKEMDIGYVWGVRGKLS